MSSVNRKLRETRAKYMKVIYCHKMNINYSLACKSTIPAGCTKDEYYRGVRLDYEYGENDDACDDNNDEYDNNVNKKDNNDFNFIRIFMIIMKIVTIIEDEIMRNDNDYNKI